MLSKKIQRITKDIIIYEKKQATYSKVCTNILQMLFRRSIKQEKWIHPDIIKHNTDYRLN